MQDNHIVCKVEQECGDEISIGTIFDPPGSPYPRKWGIELGGHNLTLALRLNGDRD